MIIAVDGVAASGKSTLGRMLAGRLGFVFFSSGLLYRLKGLMASRGEDVSLSELVRSGRFKVGFDGVLLDGRAIEEDLQLEEVGKWASKVAKDPKVRDEVNDAIRLIAKGGDIVIDGRDIGTVVFPKAPVKFFITADPYVRAKRRVLQLGMEPTQEVIEEIARKIMERDKADQNRKVAPLKPADDAVIIDTTNLTPEQAVDKMEKVVLRKVPKVPLQLVGQILVRPLARLWFGLELKGWRVPRAGRWLVISNHISGWDPPLTALAFYPRQIEFMAKEELFENALMRWLMYKLGAFPVKRHGRDMKALREAVRRLKSERMVGLYPEGHRSFTGKMLPWYPGVGYLLVKGITPVLPVAIKGVEGGITWADLIPRRRKVVVHVGRPIYPRDLYPHLTLERALEVLRDHVRELYETA